MANDLHIPFTEILKSVPEFFGIRLNEEPDFEVVDRVGDVEIRRYAPALLAEVTVAGQTEEAIGEAFERLAKYIFGENRGGEKMAMTAPVIQRDQGGAWTLSFFLSNDRSRERAPAPVDPSIRLVDAPSRLVAVLTYRGTNDDAKRESSRQELVSALQGQTKYEIDGAVEWAQYDAPFVLPFVKKNEAQVAVTERV